MGPFPMRPIVDPWEEVYHRVLQAPATGRFLQSDSMDDKNH
jgi:hypothetical protein